MKDEEIIKIKIALLPTLFSDKVTYSMSREFLDNQLELYNKIIERQVFKEVIARLSFMSDPSICFKSVDIVRGLAKDKEIEL